MPRRHRGFLDYGCYHITHRCHERKFLLKFSKDRDKYGSSQESVILQI